MIKQWRWVAIAALVALIDLGLWQWLNNVPRKRLGSPVAAEIHVSGTSRPDANSTATAASAAVAVAPEAVTAAAAIRPLTMVSAIEEIFGAKAANSMIQSTDFTRRFVATVDKLGRAKAPHWPLLPPQGPFLVDWQGTSAAIGIDNGWRYTPYVLMLESIDLPRAVQLYGQLYPQFQSAFEELGFAGQAFNDRLLTVIDQLLAAPELEAAPHVHLRATAEAAPPSHSQAIYQFDDPGLEGAVAGQKLMVRIGVLNERRVKARLFELRRLLLGMGSLP